MKSPRKIALTLAGVLMAGYAQAADPIDLSCSGTVVHRSDRTEPVANVSLVVNLDENTVTFEIVTDITSIDDNSVSFIGTGDHIAVNGWIDRVTGAASVYLKTFEANGEYILDDNYELVCRVPKRLF